MPGQRLGSFIGAVFGLVYVVVNAAPLPVGGRRLLQVCAVVAFVAVLITVLRVRSGTDACPPRRGFGRGYWLVVASMAIALIGGVSLLSGPLGLPEAGVAWTSLVVGVLFFVLAAVFRQPFFHALGAAIAVCGLAGFAGREWIGCGSDRVGQRCGSRGRSVGDRVVGRPPHRPGGAHPALTVTLDGEPLGRAEMPEAGQHRRAC